MTLWEECFEIAKAYYLEHGNLDVKCNYITESGFCLGKWLLKQRTAFGILSEEKKELLLSIGFIINRREYNWNKHFEIAKRYYLEHGDLEVPRGYSVLVDGEEFRLDLWIHNLRSAYKGNGTGKLSKEQIRKLNSINMAWSFSNKSDYVRKEWLDYYKLLKKYYIKNGNINIDSEYMEIVDGEIIELGAWLNAQLRQYRSNNLSHKKIELLELLGVYWGKDEDYISQNWLYYYNLAKIFYNENGHLFINAQYTLIDNKRVINLGWWIVTQRKRRRKNKLCQMKIDLLDEIEMFWNEDKDIDYENHISTTWMIKYGLVKKYLIENDFKPLPFAYTVRHAGHLYNLYSWVLSQEDNYRLGKLNDKKIELLSEIGIKFTDEHIKKLIKD